GRRSADAREQTRAAARASDGDDAPQRPKFNRRGRSPATLDASRELTNQFFRRAPWSFEATALRADRTQMSNLHAYEPEDPRLFRRGRLERAREDPREARLRTPAPVYLGHCPATRRIQAAIRAALDSREHVLVSGAPGTGKRTVAEILHHFSDAQGPLEQLGGRLGPFREFAYVSPLESMTLRQQSMLLEVVGSARLVLGTRLELARPIARRRPHPRLPRAW